MRRRSRIRRQHEPAELNITTFMNLMVILVPFLLITAVFSRMAILELNLPTGDGIAMEDEPQFSLEVIVRVDSIEVGDRTAGVFSFIPRVDGTHDLTTLTEKLKEVKAEFPEELAVSLLLESEVEYDVLVQVMDAVRTYRIDNPVPGQFNRAELFPEISVGDAPRMVTAES